MAIGKPADVETSLMRDLTETESQYVDELLERAERLLRARIPDLDQRAEEDQEFALLVADIEAEAVARVLRAPDNGIMRQEGEGNYSYSLNLQVASGLLDILDDDWAKLGIGQIRSVAVETDGYLTSRRQVPPQWRFQFGWGGGDQLSTPLGEDVGP
ncbi:phage Gp19/Gp15/Gp42 family protein [Brachybacterium halotolerans subsp. kimchii]|uniref:Gp19/Gp15/Gp42 family protein n=1 Tax=Brachybacterium halotolerans TaxID=2795215 RepID=UPI001E5890DE|nr:Gp19/Gp15/Gp42 family protein [Brachybacterium halotolerans]UEJ82646.1 phage Gp19/Gp15/Gp42 family protein [Brachybacterium halotolerans subsp. kimchii]